MHNSHLIWKKNRQTTEWESKSNNSFIETFKYLTIF